MYRCNKGFSLPSSRRDCSSTLLHQDVLVEIAVNKQVDPQGAETGSRRRGHGRFRAQKKTNEQNLYATIESSSSSEEQEKIIKKVVEVAEDKFEAADKVEAVVKVMEGPVRKRMNEKKH